MAVDLREINISIGSGNKFPTKTSVNLCVIERHTKKNIISLLLFAAFMTAVYLFVHYVMMAQYAEVDRMEQTYNYAGQELSALKEKNSVYNEVRAQYSHYGNGYLNDEEFAEQDRLDILDIVEQKLLSAGALENISIDGNTATLIINNKKLANVSEIVASLESNDMVEYVTVTVSATTDQNYNQAAQTASSQEKSVTSTMTIVFKNVVSADEAASGTSALADSAAEGMS